MSRLASARRPVISLLGTALFVVAGCTADNPEFSPPDAASSSPKPDFSMSRFDFGNFPNPDFAVERDMAAPATIAFLPVDATWRYLDDGSNQRASWREPGFDDSGWKAGQAELGYGDGDEKTVVGYGPNNNNKFVTTYFRAAFDTPYAKVVKKLTLRVRRDDGVVIFLNGVEVVRDNMPAGDVAYNTLAVTSINGTDETALNTFPIDPARLVEGHNVVAAEIHQQAVNSSDISFALDLIGTTQ